MVNCNKEIPDSRQFSHLFLNSTKRSTRSFPVRVYRLISKFKDVYSLFDVINLYRFVFTFSRIHRSLLDIVRHKKSAALRVSHSTQNKRRVLLLALHARPCPVQ